MLELVALIFWVYRLAIIIRALLPWFGIDRYSPVMQFLIRITEPLLGPLRRYLPPSRNLDFTPLVAILLLWAAEQTIITLIRAV
ncbi:MAG: YggT family protein, partial [Anaerolineales bacterium]